MKKNLVILNVLAISLLLSLASGVFAQQNNLPSNTVPSDLALDLQFAQKNPAPEADVINSSETKQATIVTPVGQTTAKVEEVLSPEVKAQGADQTVHLEQTTSEQVIIPPTQSDNSQTPSETASPSDQGISPNQASPMNQASPVDQSSPIPTPIPNNIPGTTIVEPDDNAAPTPVPTTAPTNTPTNTQPSFNTPAVNQSSAPSENQASPPTDNPGNPANPPSDNIQNLPDDNSAVQGLSTKATWWQKIMYLFRRR